MAGVGAGLPVVITELFINNFNFGSVVHDSITFLETSGNFEITYS